MKLRKVISGGQTGADYSALVEANRLGLQTGGTAPKGYRTDEGPFPELGSIFGLVESEYEAYAPRTRANVKDSQATVWFGKVDSPGCYCTRRACKDYRREFYPNPTPTALRTIINTYEVLNFAGNRRRTNPTVINLVKDAFKVIEAANE